MRLQHKGLEQSDVSSTLKNPMTAIRNDLVKLRLQALIRTSNCHLSTKKREPQYLRSEKDKRTLEQVSKIPKSNFRNLCQIYSYSCYKSREIKQVVERTLLVVGITITVWVDPEKGTLKRKGIVQANASETNHGDWDWPTSPRFQTKSEQITLQLSRRTGIIPFLRWSYWLNLQSPGRTGIHLVLKRYKITSILAWTWEKFLCRHQLPNSGSESEPSNKKINCTQTNEWKVAWTLKKLWERIWAAVTSVQPSSKMEGAGSLRKPYMY